MSAPAGFDELFARTPVMAILRGYDPGRTVALCERAWSVGIDVVEVPIQSDDAVASLGAAVRAAEAAGRVVGAGTVTSAERVRRAADAGARFTVAPGFSPEVLRASEDAGLPHLPGVATPTDVQHALGAGATWVKAFPASVLGTGWFRAVQGPFPGLPLVATGGIDADNAADYLAAGARVVAVGSALDDPRQLDLLAALASSATGA
ncbi:bifunctional 4-hydroxy-2-oxoglutarate aldolase/2-dehydro-3-deoxy-phosphogluconate aldolase [Nocardioides zeae]|uniref:Bifunctional 4-hydroxy-2-oxoglutarate aldolase/2-dehydro-3-deoxy-phosphogluconate aldolase n=1 Tax=Nocardioides imazamoxiresistens TaxID=3231893 RepID=A0ABU3Q1D5_9ACTN|nr:bifunctional 4-hydroxy-2-oxoglutarate aldolase/2-dehydro-3-deoxy-phosphogluconate aldolase [Nocardioides zeae]MDT9595331.1 bifunctional 4-hydroxy-2-oxoglutarate aldolase/2-dehydro-3-deoxy-phosphogluconate aldolase [Nocardioides zeae]